MMITEYIHWKYINCDNSSTIPKHIKYTEHTEEVMRFEASAYKENNDIKETDK